MRNLVMPHRAHKTFGGRYRLAVAGLQVLHELVQFVGTKGASGLVFIEEATCWRRLKFDPLERIVPIEI